MKVAFSTLGCRVNQYESEAMTEKFLKEGYEAVDYDSFADVYVINTCTVTNMGDKKSRQMIGRARRHNENAIIAVVGCYSQIAPEEVSKIEGVDIVLGTRNKGDIIYWVNRVRAENRQLVEVNDVLRNNSFEELDIEEYQDRTRAFIKIQDGCNRFCSYCLIPFARGAVCSKPPKRVIEEVEELSKNGFKEIILSGIHTASYGTDFNEGFTLVDLLEKVNEIEGIERIRIGSIDPTFFTDEVIDKIVKLKKLCPHFHLSLQSGCDATLQRMNRHYTAMQYKNVVIKLREKIADVSITTDIIVGFPGESSEEFQATYSFLKEIKLSKMHIFKFSPRKGTKAASMENQVGGIIKDERSNKLISLNKELEIEFMNKFIGRTMDVLYEKNYKEESTKFEGYTQNYIKIVSESISNIESTIKHTKLMETTMDYVKGSII